MRDRDREEIWTNRQTDRSTKDRGRRERKEGGWGGTGIRQDGQITSRCLHGEAKKSKVILLIFSFLEKQFGKVLSSVRFYFKEKDGLAQQKRMEERERERERGKTQERM